MHIVLGATGHIGSTVARLLCERGDPVTIVSRSASKASALERIGAQRRAVDVNDSEALREVFRSGQRLFLLNPPAAPSGDTDAAERSTLKSILAALEGSGLRKIVAESTYGAQPGEHVGDLGVLYEMEQALARQPIPAAIMRGAYYMTNWLAQLDAARSEGVIRSFFPVDMLLPMVDPADIGAMGARLMTAPAVKSGPHHIEGPQRYCANDVAAALTEALHRSVQAQVIPRDQWASSLAQMGFSPAAAQSFMNMTSVTLKARFPRLDQVERGTTTLDEFIDRHAGVATGS